MKRRDLLRRGGALAVGGAAAGAGAQSAGVGPVGSSRAWDLSISSKTCEYGAVAAGGIVGYAVAEETDVCGGGSQRDKEEQEADWDSWVEIYTDWSDLATSDTTRLEQARRDANGMVNLARRDGILTIYNEAVSGSSRSQAKTSYEAAVNDAFAETKRGVLNHFSERLTKLEGDLQLIRSDSFGTDWTVLTDVYDAASDNWGDPNTSKWVNVNSYTPGSDGYSMTDIDLANGETVSVLTNADSGSGINEGSSTAQYHDAVCLTPDPSASEAQYYLDPSTMNSGHNTRAYGALRVREPDPSRYDAVSRDEVDTSDFDGHQTALDPAQFLGLVDEIDNLRAGTVAEADVLLDTHFEAAKNGDISLPEMTASQGLIETARNADSFREVAMAFRTMGWAISDTAIVIEIEDAQGNVQETDAMLGWARQDQPSPLSVGTSIDPGTLPGTLYVAYNYTDAETGEQSATYGSLTGSFTVEQTEDGSDEVGFDHRGVVDTSMTPSDIVAEFRQSSDAEQDADEARRDINVDNSVDLFGGLPNLGGSDGLIAKVVAFLVGLLAIGAAFVAALKAAKE